MSSALLSKAPLKQEGYSVMSDETELQVDPAGLKRSGDQLTYHAVEVFVIFNGTVQYLGNILFI